MEDDDNQNSLPPGAIPKENRFLALIKNILIFVVLLGIVLASFIISFQLGKKILSPTKKAPEKITAAIPETPPSLKSLQKLQAIMSAESAGPAEVKPAAKAASKKHKKTCRRRAVAGKRAVRGSYYKIQAGLFADKAQAEALSEKMTASGISVFIRKVGGSWRVQAGAYKTKDMADKQKAVVDSKGFKSQVIFE
jgi:cell division protein FtsN